MVNHLIYIRLIKAVVDKCGQPNHSSTGLGPPGRIFRRGQVCIEHRLDPFELTAKYAGQLVLRLNGANLLHYDEDRRMTEELLTLVPEASIILDIIADQDTT
jgi:hypothetical protein